MDRMIELNNLPKWEYGTNKGKINWKESVGYKCKFKYYDIEGEIEIIDYIKEKQPKLVIKYLNYDLYKITTGRFISCSFAKLLKERTNEFKIEINKQIKDDKRDLIIIDREYREDNKGQDWKYYKYHCNKCGNEDWLMESNILTHKQGCNTCTSQKAKLGINTIWDTDRWMCDLGVSEEDAKKYTHCSGQKIKIKCPNCGKEKEVIIGDIYRNKSISCSCGDGMSYPEKFVSCLLNQLNIKYINQFKDSWSNNRRYDFYFELKDKKYIIETNGIQHYSTGFLGCGGRTLQQEQKNDSYKKELALSNGINYYIELDCRESTLNYIRNTIMSSKLDYIFNLNNINWLKCEEFALSNRVKEICDYWKLHNEINNEGLTTVDLSNIFKLDRHTILKYLKQGTELNWCKYDIKKELNKNKDKLIEMNKNRCSKKVCIYDKDLKLLGVFKSCSELEKQSEELFGVKLITSKISEVANGKFKQYKGFTFRYVEN